MSDDEREHIEVFQQMRTEIEGTSAAPAARRPRRAPGPGQGESWHRTDKSGSVRAAVFGVSDGLVSNTALVMGFAGASTSNSTVLFAGLAGLLAGSFSMAAGEYVSVASQRDLFRREIQIEASELRDKPEEEQKELELIYRAKGLDRASAASVAAQIMSDPSTALDTLAREELGLDPSQLGSPVRVAISSFVAFAIGASVVVIPYLFFMAPGASTTIPLVIAITLAVASMLLVGGIVGRLSGRGVVFSALRQFLWGTGAALVTFVVGRVVGVSLG
jgi:VIT1/CCC1 family predicted Fe2+/Mn2+ transporter